MQLMRSFATSLAFLLAPGLVFAQSAENTAPGAQGPMTVERLRSGFQITPEVKVTQVNRTTSELVGGSAGWVTDETFFVGGAGYWLANQSSTRKMAYGGVVLQWLARTDERIGFSVRGLLGAGSATLPETVTQVIFPPHYPFGPDGRVDPLMPRTVTTASVRVRGGFFVAEPEADLTMRLSKRVRLTGGVGYRAVSREHRDGTSLGGITGSLGLTVDLKM